MLLGGSCGPCSATSAATSAWYSPASSQGRIEPHLVVPHELPEDRVGKGETLLDPRGELHHYYGARSACLYVIRPDGYIGFRSQPPDSEALRSYFTKIFL